MPPADLYATFEGSCEPCVPVFRPSSLKRLMDELRFDTPQATVILAKDPVGSKLISMDTLYMGMFDRDKDVPKDPAEVEETNKMWALLRRIFSDAAKIDEMKGLEMSAVVSWAKKNDIEDEEVAEELVKAVKEMEEDVDWKRLVSNGGAGMRADTKEEQIARYTPFGEDSLTLQPGLAKFVFRIPDIIVTCSYDYCIKTWDAKTFKQLQFFEGHINFVMDVLQYAGDKLVSCSEDYTIRVWKRGTTPVGELELTIWASAMPIKAICLLPGHRCATGRMDNFICIHSLVTGDTLMRMADHKIWGPENDGKPDYWQKEGCGQAYGLLHLRMNIMVSCADDSSVRFWDIDKGKVLSAHIGHKGWGRDIGCTRVFSNTFAPVWKVIHLGDGGDHIATCSFDRTVVVWDCTDLSDIKVERTLRGHENSITGLFHVDKDTLAACGTDGQMKVFNWRTGDCVLTVPCRGCPTCGIGLSDGLLAMGGGDSTIRVINWRTGEDQRGANGFNAHEFIVVEMKPIFFEDDALKEDQSKDPIMYRTFDPLNSYLSHAFGPQVINDLLQEALTFADKE